MFGVWLLPKVGERLQEEEEEAAELSAFSLPQTRTWSQSRPRRRQWWKTPPRITRLGWAQPRYGLCLKACFPPYVRRDFLKSLSNNGSKCVTPGRTFIGRFGVRPCDPKPLRGSWTCLALPFSGFSPFLNLAPAGGDSLPSLKRHLSVIVLTRTGVVPVAFCLSPVT